MDYVRSVVSGQKKRFQEDGFNLDLTYIYPRLVAMAFPAAGIESLYRNPISKVVELIEGRHGRNYKVYNLSGRTYDYTKFNNQVLPFDWDDHSAPELHLLFAICTNMYQYYMEDPRNVIIVHCLAGKGRTGTVICCFLLYIGAFLDVQSVLSFYEAKRFNTEGLGVNQPCQKRYIEYFWRILQKEEAYPSVKYIQEIVFEQTPTFQSKKDSYVVAELYQEKIKVHESQIVHMKTGGEEMHTIKFMKPLPIWGDILIKFYNVGSIKRTKMMMITFNTAFDRKNFPKLELDPSQCATNDRIPDQFIVHLGISEWCNQCTTETPFEKKCPQCLSRISNLQMNWGYIREALHMKRTNIFADL